MSHPFVCPDCSSHVELDSIVRKEYNRKGVYRCVDCEADFRFDEDVRRVVSGGEPTRAPEAMERLLRWLFG